MVEKNSKDEPTNKPQIVKPKIFENLDISNPELIKVQENYKRITLNDFDSSFNILSISQPSIFVKVVKRICILHKDADIRYITLKDQLKYTTDATDNISQETITVVSRLIKEILRQVNETFIDSKKTETGEDEENKKPENMIHMSTLVNCFGMMMVRRYSVIMPFVMKYNISKIIKTFKNHSNLEKYLNPLFKTESDS